MPRGSGIYEDEPRDHRHSYSTDSNDEHEEPGQDPTPDDSASKEAGEPTG